MYWTKGIKFSEFNIMTLSEISILVKEFDQSDDERFEEISLYS